MSGMPGSRHLGRIAVPTSVAGTIAIAAGAFWLSFTALADLARRSGVGEGQAWAWPLIVDGIIVVSTVAVVALSGLRAAWYPWSLLIAGAGLSVTANAIHAVVAADADVPDVLAASVAAVPPLVLLAITHLTVVLTRHRGAPAPVGEPHAVSAPESPVLAVTLPPGEEAVLAEGRSGVVGPEGRAIAAVLRDAGWSNKRIAQHLGIAPSTVGRWYPKPDPVEADSEHRAPAPSESEMSEENP